MSSGISVEDAITFVWKMHDGQMRDEGIPYFLHPMAVAMKIAQKGYDEEHIITALFHDILEDCKISYRELSDVVGFRVGVMPAVHALTKTDTMTHREYYTFVCQDPIARVVKVADRIHNLESMHHWPEKKQRFYLEKTHENILPFAHETKLLNDLINVMIKRHYELNRGK